MSSNKQSSRKKIVLLITVGAQDVKRWVYDAKDGGLKHAWIDKPGLRAKHLAIRNHPDAWAVLSEQEVREKNTSIAAPSKSVQALLSAISADRPVFSSDGRLCLAAPKLEPVAEAIHELEDRLEVAGAIIFYTERLEHKGRVRSDKDYENEPVASGQVAARYLGERFKLNSDRISVVNCMEDCAGRFEGGLNEHDDFPLRREIVHRMDSAVKKFVEELGEDFARGAVPVTLTTGGHDAFKQVVPAIAELRFVASVRDLSAPETKERDAPLWCKLVDERLCAESPRISRHEAISARGRALDLLRRGDPVSAWAAVHGLAGSQLDTWWLLPLECTASYFGGAGGSPAIESVKMSCLAPGNQSATNTWLEALREVELCAQDDFEQHKRYALNAAMKVELALQGHDRQSRRYADALASVCTMIDAAVIARAVRFLEKNDNRERIEGLIEKYERARDWFFLHRKAEHSKGATPNNSRNAWFGEWKEQIQRENPELHADLKEHFTDLIELERLLGIQNSKGQSLRALRNTASHRALTGEHIAQIADLAEHQSRPLWNPPGPQPIGGHALGFADADGGPDPIPAVLKSIEVDEPADTYRSLVGSLESILLTYEPETTP